ncbi:DUF3119 family protein [Prochlorococcus marinus]|uniref:DUF3119 family protein n=1 Tax=Prochlorococcus marinus TaxID=1219 RepID=UPI0022B599FB|nr:DUF3119 family protein [Prochlorococcus marinus]
MNSSSEKHESNEIVLEPMYRLPALIILTGVPIFLTPLPIWIGVLISSFGFFLLLQTFTLRIKFTDKDLIVLQLGKEIRRFPYENWVAWRIFFPQLPGILYFRETASPHLLPIIFDKKMLELQLKLHLGNLEINNKKEIN